MSDIETTCPYCNSLFSVDEAYAGQNLPCPNCGNSFQVASIPPPVQIAQPIQQQAAPMYQPTPMGGVPQPMYQQPQMGAVQQPMYQQPQMGGVQQPMYQPTPMGGVQQPMYQQPPVMRQPVMGQPYMSPQGAYGYKPKERLVYILLGLFLGNLGIHNFYAGYTGKAVAQLLITVLSLGWLFLIVTIWVIVDVCTVREDAQGIPFV